MSSTVDSGEAGDFLYYVMPFVAGESLRERLQRQGELPVPEAARILSQVVDALAHAHQHGVVAYELLTGRPPFAWLPPQEVLAAHVTHAPEPVLTAST
jgi:serine/threonine protein kinase